MAYVLLLAAIAFEVLGTSLLSTSDGFTRPAPTAGCLAAYAVAFVFLAQVVRELPVGLVYAMWSGLGTAAIVAVGAVFLGDRLTGTALAGVALVIAGVVLLNVGGAH